MSKVTRAKPKYKLFGPSVVGPDGYMLLPPKIKERTVNNENIYNLSKHKVNEFWPESQKRGYPL